MTTLIQDIHFETTPDRVFDALTSAEKHSAFTGAPAEVTSTAGDAWTAFGGAISGRNIEIVPGERIVQAWRPGNWPAGQFSMVCIELSADATGTKLHLSHTGIPEGQSGHLDQGWHDRYWTPLRKWLADS